MLNKVMIRLGESASGKDVLIQQLIDDAQDDVLAYTHLNEIPKGLESTVRDITIIYYNRLGIEGQNSHSEGGISHSIDDMPESILRKLRSFRKLVK